MHLQTLLITLTLALTIQTTATPIPLSLFARDATLTESQVKAIAPKSNTCDDAPAKGECATAKQAAKFTSKSFTTYKVTSKAEQAAIISLMAFESGDFKYNKNHYPGVAGQGSKSTYNTICSTLYVGSIQSLTIIPSSKYAIPLLQQKIRFLSARPERQTPQRKQQSRRSA